MKQSHEDIKIRPLGDSRLRPPDQRGRNAPSSPHRKISRDPLPFHKDTPDGKKSSEVTRKLRKDSSPRTVVKDLGCSVRKPKDNLMADNCPVKETNNGLPPPGKVSSSPRCNNGESHSSVCNGTSDVFNASDRNSDVTKTSSHFSPGIIPSRKDDRESMDNVMKGCADSEKSRDKVGDSAMTDSEVMKNSHDSDDFDCPCCDRTSALADGPMSDAEIHVFTTCDVIAPSSPEVKTTPEDVSDKVRFGNFF